MGRMNKSDLSGTSFVGWEDVSDRMWGPLGESTKKAKSFYGPKRREPRVSSEQVVRRESESIDKGKAIPTLEFSGQKREERNVVPFLQRVGVDMFGYEINCEEYKTLDALEKWSYRTLGRINHVWAPESWETFSWKPSGAFAHATVWLKCITCEDRRVVAKSPYPDKVLKNMEVYPG